MAKVTLIIPTLNEASAIGNALSEMPDKLLDEVIVVAPRGCERMFLENWKRLARRGYDVRVLTMQYDRNISNKELIEGIVAHGYAHYELGRDFDGIEIYVRFR